MSYEDGLVLINEIDSKYKTAWEQTRWLAYVNASAMGAKLKRPTDLVKFSWEIENNVKVIDNRSNQEITQELKDIMKKGLNI